MLGTRVFAAVVSIALLGATLEPLIRKPWEDGFPLSPYPMFAFKRPTKMHRAAIGSTAPGLKYSKSTPFGITSVTAPGQISSSRRASRSEHTKLLPNPPHTRRS